MRLLTIVLLVFTVFSCGPDPKKEPEVVLVEEESIPDEVELDETWNDEGKNDLDSIEFIVQEWNRALNESDFPALAELYADEVQFYKRKVSKSELLNAKRKALKSSAYEQSINYLSIEYPTDGTDLIRCVFEKKYQTMAIDTHTVRAVLELQFVDNIYTIIKETDCVTDLRLLEEEESISLNPDKYYFTYDYWKDTRHDAALGHSMVPYTLSVGLDNRDADSIKVTLFWYSGSLRTYHDFHVKNIELTPETLSFKAAPIFEEYEEQFEDEEVPYDEEDYHSYTFKLLGDELGLLQTDGWFQEMAGVRLWRNDSDDN